MDKYRYPCTGHIGMQGFGEYLEKECIGSRRNIRLFTEELRREFKVPYLSLVNSGSSANLVAALAMAKKLRDTGKPLVAAVSAFTFPTTISSLLLAGFSIRMVDVETDGFNMDSQKLKDVIDGCSLIVPTHFLGFSCDMVGIRKLADEHGCLILQDGCETLRLEIGGKPAFSYGDILTWSFYHPHHLSSYGGGGVICLHQDDYILIDSIIHWGRACRCHIDPALCKNPDGPAHQFTYENIGVNVEMSELNAAFGRWQLRCFPKDEEKRLQNYQLLYEHLKDCVGIRVYPHPDSNGSLFVFPVQLTNGLSVGKAYEILRKKGVEIRTLMGGVTNEQPAFNHLSSKFFMEAHKMAEQTFFVGVHQTLPVEDVQAVARILKENL